MSNSNSKPSYAAIVQSPPSPGNNNNSKNAGPGAGPSAQAGSASDAPPPYSEPSSHSQQAFRPHQTTLPPPHQPHQGYYIPPGDETGVTGWTPPTEAVARSRALKRFWVSFFWAWAIWILVGLIVGGGVSDVETNPAGRRGHWDKHGDWHNDKVAAMTVASASAGAGVPFESSSIYSAVVLPIA